MEALIRPFVTTPFSVNDVMSTSSRDIAKRAELCGILQWDHIGVSVGIVVTIKERTKGLIFKVIPGERNVRIKHKIWLGDPVTELLRIEKVWTPKDVPLELVATGRHVGGRPIHGGIPWSAPAEPSLAIKATDIVGER